eukprot:11060555-Prorocentrum_lima.AAC.1
MPLALPPPESMWKREAIGAASPGVDNSTSVKDRRAIIEYCCLDDSIIANMAPPDCKVVRFIEKADMTTIS